MFITIMRWISLGLSLFAMCISSYSLWLSVKRNRDLFRKNLDLTVENAELRALCDSYWEEIVELRERVFDGEENLLQEAVETTH